jgi:hypothetical protein
MHFWKGMGAPIQSHPKAAYFTLSAWDTKPVGMQAKLINTEEQHFIFRKLQHNVKRRLITIGAITQWSHTQNYENKIFNCHLHVIMQRSKFIVLNWNESVVTHMKECPRIRVEGLTKTTTVSRAVVFNLFCSRTPRYNFSSTLYPQSCCASASYTYCIIYVPPKMSLGWIPLL